MQFLTRILFAAFDDTPHALLSVDSEPTLNISVGTRFISPVPTYIDAAVVTGKPVWTEAGVAGGAVYTGGATVARRGRTVVQLLFAVVS